MCFFCLWPFCHRLLGDGRSATETFPRSWGGFCPLLAASQEIVCLSIPGFRLHLRFWERPCSRKKKYLFAQVPFLGETGPNPVPMTLISVTCQVPAHTHCISAWAPEEKEVLTYFSPGHSSFPSSGRMCQHGRCWPVPHVETTAYLSHRFSRPFGPGTGVSATRDLPHALPWKWT